MLSLKSSPPGDPEMWRPRKARMDGMWMRCKQALIACSSSHITSHLKDEWFFYYYLLLMISSSTTVNTIQLWCGVIVVWKKNQTTTNTTNRRMRVSIISLWLQKDRRITHKSSFTTAEHCFDLYLLLFTSFYYILCFASFFFWTNRCNTIIYM